jgi:2-hydroxychromene-2-carboxylate isomerase
MPGAKAPLEFWFDFASTYSYLAAMRLEAFAKAKGVTVQWRPFLLGPIFREQGWNDSPFNIYPVKGRYMWRDLERKTQAYGIPFQKPTQFPRNGLIASRIALLGSAEPWGPEFIRRVYTANFALDQDISDAGALTRILNELGQDGAAMMESVTREEVKTALRLQTERAKSLGIFGAPSFTVNGELFWGDDRLEEAVEWWKNSKVEV